MLAELSSERDELVRELARSRRDLVAADAALQHSEALRRDAVARETALQHELQHRARNMLATIRSMFNRTIDTADTLQGAADHFQGRLDTLARYQILLAHRPSSAVDLEMLVRDELLTIGFDASEQVTLRGSTVHLPLKVAEVVGLAVHELATNALKFGALSAANGRLAISWETAPERAELSIEWVETGVPVIASAPLRAGFGREYIEAALPYELDAQTSFELRPGGLFCRIGLPAKSLEP
jgi:two-component system CheB/CheR fusion protein